MYTNNLTNQLARERYNRQIEEVKQHARYVKENEAK